MEQDVSASVSLECEIVCAVISPFADPSLAQTRFFALHVGVVCKEFILFSLAEL